MFSEKQMPSILARGALLAAVMGMLPAAESCDTYEDITCSSRNYRLANCPVSGSPPFAVITLLEQLSKSKCEEGTSFGYRAPNLWVDNGCRAKFALCKCNLHQEVDCASNGYDFTGCRVPGAAAVNYVQVHTQKSKSGCILDQSFGIAGSRIWVDKGCRATFDVCYRI